MGDPSQQFPNNGSSGGGQPPTVNGGRIDNYSSYIQSYNMMEAESSMGIPLNSNQGGWTAQAVYNTYQSIPSMGHFSQQQPMYQQQQQLNTGGAGGRRMKPNAAPFCPTRTYNSGGDHQQQQQQRPFAFNPFGYNNQQRSSQPQQSHGYNPNQSSLYTQTGLVKQQPQGYHNQSQQQQQFSNGYTNQPQQQQQQQAPVYYPHPQQPPQQLSPGKEAMVAAGEGGIEGGNPAQQYALSDHLQQRMQASENSAALFEILIGLEQLVADGGEFETWASAIQSRLISQEFGEEDLCCTAALIAEMAILVPDAQYNFARLCYYQEQTIGDFVMHYLIPVLDDTLSTHAEFFNADNHCNFLLFLAELYEKAAKGQGNPLLGKLVVAELHNILSTTTTEMTDQLLKAAVKALKLTGRFLEAEPQGAEEIDKLFEKLHASCASEGHVSESVKAQVLSLVQQRNNNWGVTSTEKGASSSSSNWTYAPGPDGKALTEEEAAFLDENIATLAGDEDEFAEDYERFLAATAVRTAEKALEKLSVDEEEDGDNTSK